MNQSKRIHAQLLCALFASGILPSYSCSAAGSSDPDLRPELVARQPLIIPGVVESESDVRRLSFGQAGRVQRIDVKEGDRVRRGQSLAALDCTEANAALAIAEAELELQRVTSARRTRAADPADLQVAKDRLALAEEDLRSAEATLVRMQSLSQDKSLIPKYEIQAAFRREKVARLDVSIAQQALNRLQSTVFPEDEQEDAVREKLRVAHIARARYQISLCSISSPVTGTVVAVYASAGEMVTGSEPILHIVEDGDRLAVLCMPDFTEEYPLVGQKVRLKLPRLKDAMFEGELVRVRSPSKPSASCALQAWVTSHQQQLSQAPLNSLVYAYFD